MPDQEKPEDEAPAESGAPGLPTRSPHGAPAAPWQPAGDGDAPAEQPAAEDGAAPGSSAPGLPTRSPHGAPAAPWQPAGDGDAPAEQPAAEDGAAPGSSAPDEEKPEDEAPADEPSENEGAEDAEVAAAGDVGPEGLPTRDSARPADGTGGLDALEAFGHEGVDEGDPVFGSVHQRRRGPLVAVATIVVLALVAGLAWTTLAGDDDTTEGFAPPPPDSPLALQAQVRSFADAWVGGDLEVAAGYAGVCVDELGTDGAVELLDLTLSAVEAFQGVPREQLSIRRVVTRSVGGDRGEARIDLDPAPFEDPLDAVGQFLPWRLEDDVWGLDTCTFGGPPLDADTPTDRTRSDVIRALLGIGYGEEIAICVGDALIGDFGLAALDPADLTDAQDAVRLAAEETCRSAPTQAGPGFGTPDSPVPLGAVGRVGDWDARVVDVVPDATEIVMDAFDFNEPPPEGEQLLLARLELTYRGEPETTATLLDLGFRLESSTGRTYDEFDDTCGLFPDEIDQVASVGPGEVLRGTMCWSVLAADASAVALVLDSLVTLDDPKVWFSLG